MEQQFAGWRKKYFTIWTGQGISTLTSSIVQMAIIWYITGRTKSAAVLSFATLAGFLPQAVLGGCTIMMFGTILTSGVQMIAKCGFSQRNIVIVSLSLAVGIGFTTASEIGIWNIFPELVQSVFSANVVAVVFVVSVFLSLVLPKDMDIKALEG
mgnify:CR=1 FL=1